MNALQRTVVIALIVACMSTLGGVIFLDEYYYRRASRVFDAKAGKIYPRNVKSFAGVSKVYLTNTEQLPYEYWWYVEVIFAITAFTLNQRWRCFPPFVNR